jgi:streptogramin lyase
MRRAAAAARFPRHFTRLACAAVLGAILGFGSSAMAQAPGFVLQWGTYGSGNGEFGRLYHLAVNGLGIVYVADYTNNRVQTFDSTGTYLSQWGSYGQGDGQFFQPFGVGIGASGDVYVTDQANHRIQEFTPAGAFVRKWGTYGSGNSQFNYPAGIAVGPDGSVYVADYGNARVQKFTAAGAYVTQWGDYGTGPGQFGAPYAIAVSAANGVYVADVNNDRITQFTEAGEFLSMWGSAGSGPGQMHQPTGLGLGPDGNVYVGDHANDRVDAFSPGGAFLYSWGGSGSPPDRFYGPNGIATSGPNVYVADYFNTRIQRFSFSVVRPPETSPTHYLVDPAGHGDFTSIQPAIDAILGSSKDTIVVASGVYPESALLPAVSRDLYVVGAEGASATTVHAIQATFSSPTRWHVSGLTLANDGDFTGCDFHACAFLGVVRATLSLKGGSAFSDCDFYRPVNLNVGSQAAPVAGSRFHSAPLSLRPGALGGVGVHGCTFEGPGDTLVSAGGDQYDRMYFGNCVFRNATNGANFSGGGGFSGCRFQDLTGLAIWSESTCSQSHGVTELQVTSCRFERCGSAIRWLGACEPLATLEADTVIACTGDAITVSESAYPSLTGYSLRDLVVEGGGGHGITARLDGSFRRVRISSCRVQNVAGDGIRLIDESAIGHTYASCVIGSRVDHVGGAGLRVQSANVTLVGNLAWANGGDGIAFTTLHQSGSQADSVVSNTCVGNSGAGIRMEYAGGLTGVNQVVQRNLAASNLGAGIAVATPFRGSVALDDAWGNGAGDFSGVVSPADSNLVTDPLLCAATLGDFGLQSESPCAPGGAYGLIGARPVGCDAAAGIPPAPTELGFSARPNPARGAVEFAAPSRAGGRIELIDVLGRRIWSHVLRAGERTRWDGRGEAGPAVPGVYLARFTSGGTQRTVRIVWLGT